MSQRAIFDLETDRREPHPSTLGKLAGALCVEPSKLLWGLSHTNVVSSKLGSYRSGRHHNRHHNPVATPGISWRFTASLPANIQLRRVLPQPMAVYDEVWDVPENHWCPRFESGSRYFYLFASYRDCVDH
jgi:hypothetical protein